MKIAIGVALFPPKWIAGTEIATYNIAQYLAKQGHDVHIITSLDDNLNPCSFEAGFHIHRVKCPQFRYVEKDPLYPKRPRIRLCSASVFLARSLDIIRKIEPDFILVQGIDMGILGFISAIILKVPYVVWGRGDDVYLNWKFKGIISYLVLKYAIMALALTDDMKLAMLQMYEREMHVIPNGINTDLFKNKSKNLERIKYSIGESDKIVLFVGRITPIKGINYLIDAILICVKQKPEIRLFIVGDGNEKCELQRKVHENGLENFIIFAGEKSHEDIPCYMAAADILVLPSLSEGFPVTILEAMASGLPIIATNVGGLPAIIEDGVNGYLVKSKNHEEIAEKILFLFDNPNLMESIKENNKKKSNDFNWNNITISLIDKYCLQSNCIRANG